MSDKMEKLMANYQSTIDKAGVMVLHSIVGEWAVECLKSNTPMTVATFEAWSASRKLNAGQKKVIDELLTEINQ